MNIPNHKKKQWNADLSRFHFIIKINNYQNKHNWNCLKTLINF